MNKLYDVKGFTYEEIDRPEMKRKHQVRKVIFYGSKMNWKDAKDCRKRFSFAQASIYPHKEEKLKIIKLS